MIRLIYDFLIRHYKKNIYSLYRIGRGSKIKRLRKKKIINVLFVAGEIGSWKTKLLYDAMLRHSRFNPIIGVTTASDNQDGKKTFIDFLKDNDYSFVDLDSTPQHCQIHPDIIFYQKPYDYAYANPSVRFNKHLKSLFCHVNYAFHSMDTTWAAQMNLYECVWQHYYENALSATPKGLIMLPDGGKQAVITGLPIQDQLLTPKENFKNPWKHQDTLKRRIIYAPHHTIGEFHLKGIGLSSFLENGEYILQLMHKYADKVQWAFKPHPLLYNKLLNVWGKEKTDAYYDEWKKAENSQVEDGEYDALFKWSDAMIHDCCSFTIEYHYTHKPVLYLIRKDGAESDRNAFGQKAFDLHYKGQTKEDIEQFIQNVIDGVDPMKDEREKFFEDYLIPPHGKTACENIINAILGEAEYNNI